MKSIMYVAIRVGDDVPAAFALSTTQQHRRWSEVDIDLAKAIADQTGIAIRQAELYQKAESTSTREALVNRLTMADSRLVEFAGSSQHGDPGIGSRVVGVASSSLSLQQRGIRFAARIRVSRARVTSVKNSFRSIATIRLGAGFPVQANRSSSTTRSTLTTRHGA